MCVVICFGLWEENIYDLIVSDNPKKEVSSFCDSGGYKPPQLPSEIKGKKATTPTKMAA